jgi:hypothetical protein
VRLPSVYIPKANIANEFDHPRAPITTRKVEAFRIELQGIYKAIFIGLVRRSASLDSKPIRKKEISMSPLRAALRPIVAILAGLAVMQAASASADTTLLNVSYDVARELYKDINPAFAAHWQRTAGEKLTINQSHGGSSKQIQSVVAGLEADVVTMNQAPTSSAGEERPGLSADWRKAFPHGAAPYVEHDDLPGAQGQPQGHQGLERPARAGLQVVVPNPKTSGNGRYTYLAAWGYALSEGRQRRRRAGFRRASCSPTCRCSTAAGAVPPPPLPSAASVTCW